MEDLNWGSTIYKEAPSFDEAIVTKYYTSYWANEPNNVSYRRMRSIAYKEGGVAYLSEPVVKLLRKRDITALSEGYVVEERPKDFVVTRVARADKAMTIDFPSGGISDEASSLMQLKKVIIPLFRVLNSTTARALKVLLALSEKGFAVDLANAKKLAFELPFDKVLELNDSELFLEFYLSSKTKLVKRTLDRMLNGEALAVPKDSNRVIERTRDYCLFGSSVPDPIYFRVGSNFYCYDRLEMLKLIAAGRTETPEGWTIPSEFIVNMQLRYPNETAPTIEVAVGSIDYNTFNPNFFTYGTIGEWLMQLSVPKPELTNVELMSLKRFERILVDNGELILSDLNGVTDEQLNWGMELSSANGNIDNVKVLMNRTQPTERNLNTAIKNGQLDLVIYLVERLKLKLSKQSIYLSNPRYEVLSYVVERLKGNGIRSSGVLKVANDDDILEYLVIGKLKVDREDAIALLKQIQEFELEKLVGTDYVGFVNFLQKRFKLTFRDLEKENLAEMTRHFPSLKVRSDDGVEKAVLFLKENNRDKLRYILDRYVVHENDLPFDLIPVYQRLSR